MLDSIASNADIIIAAVQTTLTLDMLPTVWHQWRAKASTVPLTSSLPTAIGLGVLGVVFFASGLFIATGTVIVGSAMWAVVAAQRVAYNKSNGRTDQAPDADPKLRFDDDRLSGSSPVDIRYPGSQCNCIYHLRAGRCWHDYSPSGGSKRQEAGMGLDGDSQGTSSAIEKVPDLVHNPPASALDIHGDRIEVEEGF